MNLYSISLRKQKNQIFFVNEILFHLIHYVERKYVLSAIKIDTNVIQKVFVSDVELKHNCMSKSYDYVFHTYLLELLHFNLQINVTVFKFFSHLVNRINMNCGVFTN